MHEPNSPTQSLRQLFEDALASCGQSFYPGDEAMSCAARHILAGSGKRVRPLLCLLSAEAVGGSARAALNAAVALEFIHNYSLAHDDLPCMDDDHTRRGRPTAHVIYGEAQALLAGDALLTDAFTLIAGEGLAGAELPPAATRLAMVQELAGAAGGSGMVLGQSLDLHWTARQGAKASDLDGIHTRKTGYLLGASAALGALAGGGDGATVGQFRMFGRLLGLAFQILDDVLDESEATGKSCGKDKAAGKLTYLTLMTAAQARAAAEAYTAQALAAIAPVVEHGPLIEFVTALLRRTF